MPLKTLIRAITVAATIAGSAALTAAFAWEPARGSPVRTAILQGLRPHVERDLGAPILFVVSRLALDGHWAFVSAKPMRATGVPIDWTRTRFARDFAADMMSDVILALLKSDGQTWQVVEYALGPTDVTWVEWIDKYSLKSSLFDPSEDQANLAAPPPDAPPVATPPRDIAPPPQVAVSPLAPPPAASSGPPPTGWRQQKLGDVSFVAPSDWRRIDDPATPLKIGGEPWNATFASRPSDDARGIKLVFSWADPEYIYARGMGGPNLKGEAAVQLQGHAATRTDFAIKDRYNDAAGFDVVTNAKVAGGLLSVGCRAPNADWPTVRPVCERVLMSVTFALPGAPPVAASPAQPASKPAATAATSTKDQAFRAFTTALERFEAFETSKKEEDWRIGMEQAQQATELDPNVADYWRTLGYGYSLGASEVQAAGVLAEEAFDKAIELDPRNATSRLLLAGVLVKRQSFSKALDNLEIALDLKTDLATGALVADMCRIYLADEQGQRGERFFARFVSMNPRVQAARLGQAILLSELGRGADALPLAERVAADPATPKADAEHARTLIKAIREKQQ